MRTAYLDCFAGISGDMFLAALLDAGVAPAIFHEAVAALNLGASLRIETVDRSGISCTKVHVLEGEQLAEGTRTPDQEHSHPHQHDEVHAHTHSAARSLTSIRALIQTTSLSDSVKQTAIQTFELLGASEAKIHNIDIEQIHFHEVGAVDAIVDIVAASAGVHALNGQALAGTGQPIQWHCSPINVGSGTVECAHGRFPVPAPATADLLRGLPTYSAHIEKELVTPTGAAILRTLAPLFGPQPAMRVSHIGYGAGTRNPKDFPNVLRLSIGDTFELPTSTAPVASTARIASIKNPSSRPEAAHFAAAAESLPLLLDGVVQSMLRYPSRPLYFVEETAQSKFAHFRSGPEEQIVRMGETETVTILETALDDLSPQILATIIDRALALGAYDAMLTPVLMKKGRPGTLVTILTDEQNRPALERLLFTETSTLGIRIRRDQRTCLSRTHTTVNTPYGPIRIKLGILDGQVLNAAPEFEDCRTAATTHSIPVKQVIQAATAAYFNSQQ